MFQDLLTIIKYDWQILLKSFLVIFFIVIISACVSQIMIYRDKIRKLKGKSNV